MATQEHTQQTLLKLGDEFLLQYLICAHSQFRGNFILSRLFSMGHSLELYLKASLIDITGAPPKGHDIVSLINKLDPTLKLGDDEISRVLKKGANAENRPEFRIWEKSYFGQNQTFSSPC